MDDSLLNASQAEQETASQAGESHEPEVQGGAEQPAEASSQSQDELVNSEQSSANWYFDEEMPGQGEPPEWFKASKYKTVADQAKAYNELEKQFGAFTGAPEQYDLSLESYPDAQFEPDDPVLSKFLEEAKEANASQEFVSKALERYMDVLHLHAPDPEEEKKKLGPDADEQARAVQNWASQHLGPDEMETLSGMVKTAEALRVVQKLKQAATKPDVAVETPPQQQQQGERELKEMMDDPRFNEDPQFRQEFYRKAHQVWG